MDGEENRVGAIEEEPDNPGESAGWVGWLSDQTDGT